MKPTAQGQVESSINDTINFIMAKVAAGEIDAATATELIAAARKDYESNVPVTTSAQQAVQLQQTANPYQANPQTAYAVLDGAERLALLNSQLNPLKPFNFDYRRDISARMVQTTKDCIAPMTLDFKPEGLADCFKTGDMWGQVLVIKKLGSELTDQALSDITELPIPLNVTWFAQPMDKAAAVAFTRQRLAWIDKEIIEEQRSAVQKGYDFSILPQELKYSKEETEDVIDNLQNKNQRLYVFTGLFYTYAPTKKQLDNQVLSIISAARQNSIEVSTYEYRQRQGFNSILPLGHNHCEISRMSTTAEVSILMPFATMELDDKGGNYYGQNKHSSNLIFCNRKLLASPMGFVCGKTGSGKGMAVKTEMSHQVYPGIRHPEAARCQAGTRVRRGQFVYPGKLPFGWLSHSTGDARAQPRRHVGVRWAQDDRRCISGRQFEGPGSSARAADSSASCRYQGVLLCRR